MRVERIEFPATEWESLVARCGGNPLHLPAIHFADHDPEKLCMLTFVRDGTIVACATAFTVEAGRRRWLGRGNRVLLLPTAPAMAATDSPREVWNSLVRFGRDAGYHRLRVLPGYSPWLPGMDLVEPYRTGAITEFVIDLRRTEEDVLAAVHKTHRKNARRAAKQGLRLQEDNSLGGLLRLRDMQQASSERASRRTEGFSVRKEGFFRKLHEHVYEPGYGHLLFALLGDEPVAALAWLRGAGRVMTVRSGSLPRGYESRAMYLLYDQLIRGALQDGIVELNIGGVPVEASDPGHPQSGLYEFKNGFGGEPMVRYGLDVPLGEMGG